MSADDDLIIVRDSARLACTIIAKLAEGEARRNSAKNVLDSLLARARSAPQLLSTWGAAPFLIFYASKAVDAGPALLKELAKVVEENGLVGFHYPDKFNETAAGYAIYLTSLLYYHKKLRRPAGLLCERRCNFVKLLDALIDHYLRTPSAHRLQFVVENLSRFITIYAAPVKGSPESIGYLCNLMSE